MEQNNSEINVNYTQEEKDHLVSLAKEKKDIIENNKSVSDVATLQDEEDAWKAKDIETAFDASSELVFRDHKQAIQKYEAMKRDMRKKRAVSRADPYKTGGTNTKLTPIEQKVLEIFVLSLEKSYSDDDLPSASSSTPTLSPAEEKKEQPDNEQTLKDEITIEDSEPPSKRVSGLSQGGEAMKNSSARTQNHSKQWKKKNPMATKTKKCLVLNKGREERPFDKLTKEKIKIARIQKQIVTMELEQKLIQNTLLKKELEHKDVMHKLEKQHLLLKIEILKKSLAET